MGEEQTDWQQRLNAAGTTAPTNNYYMGPPPQQFAPYPMQWPMVMPQMYQPPQAVNYQLPPPVGNYQPSAAAPQYYYGAQNNPNLQNPPLLTATPQPQMNSENVHHRLDQGHPVVDSQPTHTETSWDI